MAFQGKRPSERWEAILRIPIGFVSGVILGFWKMAVEVALVLHWLLVIITGRRNLNIANFANAWITEYYGFTRYMNFTTNERPFPFTPLRKPVQPVKK